MHQSQWLLVEAALSVNFLDGIAETKIEKRNYKLY